MKLSAYLAETGETQLAFSRRIRVHASQITRFLNGERLPGRDLCLRIERATDGKVTVHDWDTRQKDAAA